MGEYFKYAFIAFETGSKHLKSALEKSMTKNPNFRRFVSRVNRTTQRRFYGDGALITEAEAAKILEAEAEKAARLITGSLMFLSAVGFAKYEMHVLSKWNQKRKQQYKDVKEANINLTKRMDKLEASFEGLAVLVDTLEASFQQGTYPFLSHVVDEEDELDESEIELDDSDVVDGDNDTPQKMGDPSVEVSEENRAASQEAKSQAMEAISEGKLGVAIEHLTTAILLNPTSPIMYGIRANVFIKMKKPNAAIRDATAALEITPDSAEGYKSRGIAKAMLGQWEEAAKDLHVASKLDKDEEVSSVLKKVELNVNKIEEHRRKYDMLRKEREERKVEHERQRRRAEAQAKKLEQSSSKRPGGGMPGGSFPGGMPRGFPGGMPGGGFPGGMPGGGFPGGMPSSGGFPGGMPQGNVDYSKILNDPELMAALQNPEIMAALRDVMKNPANLKKHQSNPKVALIIAKMIGKFAGPE